ncbi:MAG: phosphoglucomutase, alpha-D-glucose phosphate-specific, partial [Calditrichia bacterium]|nr:phosphoglucomutase, alpha-D-glucose phosphate-specific [Calditrichia bacterium]
AEITAKTKLDPGKHYKKLEQEFGSPVYERLDAPATFEQKEKLKSLDPEYITAIELAGEKILTKLSHAPGNNAAIGGIKVTTQNGWFAARPSGTENIYKIYAESFIGKDHLKNIQEEAQKIVLSVVG